MAAEIAPLESIPKTKVTATETEIAAGAGCRVLHIDRVGWYYNEVLDSDKTTPLYTIKNKYCITKSGPQMTIKKAETDETVGTVTIHPLLKNMDLVVKDKNICLEASSAFTTGRIFASQAAPGRRFHWAFDNSLGRDMLCKDNEEKVVAKFEGCSSLNKNGKNCFTFEAGIEGDLLDEILVSGLAMAERRAQRNRHGFGGTVISGIRVAGHPIKGSSRD